MEQLEVIQTNGMDSIIAQEKAQIDVQISTAKAYPRNIKRSIDNAIAIATLDQATAETCTYSVPRGGKKITGPSVHLAKIIAQVWGNMRIEAKVVATDQTTVTSQAIAFDLESNVAIKVEVKKSITQNEWSGGVKTGRLIRMSEDMIVVTGNAANSIALRNAVFSVIPKAVTDKVYGEAIKAITGDVSDQTKLMKKRKQVFDKFIQSYKLTEEEVLGAIGKASIDNVTPEDLAVLIGLGTALKDGDTTVDEAFRNKNTSKNTAPKEDPFEARALNFIKECTTLIDLEVVWNDIQNQIEGKASEELIIAYQGKTMDLQEEVN